jgi:hypothetical protein
MSGTYLTFPELNANSLLPYGDTGGYCRQGMASLSRPYVTYSLKCLNYKMSLELSHHVMTPIEAYTDGYGLAVNDSTSL